MDKDSARELLREHELRATAPRMAVVQLLARSARPLSCSEALEQLGSQDWDPATVYRNLVRLEEEGLARVVSRAGGMARYEFVTEAEPPEHAHPHFVCVDCGEVSCLPAMASPHIEADERWRDAVEHASIQLQGSCPDCRERG